MAVGLYGLQVGGSIAASHSQQDTVKDDQRHLRHRGQDIINIPTTFITLYFPEGL